MDGPIFRNAGVSHWMKEGNLAFSAAVGSGSNRPYWGVSFAGLRELVGLGVIDRFGAVDVIVEAAGLDAIDAFGVVDVLVGAAGLATSNSSGACRSCRATSGSRGCASEELASVDGIGAGSGTKRNFHHPRNLAL
jgi:hypothetical protein